MINNSNTSNLNNQYEQMRKQIAEQDIYRAFVLNAGSVKPEAPQGYLLKSRNPVSSVIISAQDMGKDVVELSKALAKGESNDNQLGRFNDLGMKLSGLGIAAYLSTRRGTATKGMMEFIGPLAFFSSMAAWPNLFIAKPLEHKFGFDIRQKYVDSQGRKKYFFQDNQYQPWELWSDEQLDKVADKMNISKDVKDRRELTKEKMRTVALQGNTLWMLTAGFSPILTSFICSALEQPVTDAYLNHRVDKMLKGVDNIAQDAIKKAESSSFDVQGAKGLNGLITRYSHKPLDKKFFTEACDYMNPLRTVYNAKDIDDSNLFGELESSGANVRKALVSRYDLVRHTGFMPLEKLTERFEQVGRPAKRTPQGKRIPTSPKAVEDFKQILNSVAIPIGDNKYVVTLKQVADSISSMGDKMPPETAERVHKTARAYADLQDASYEATQEVFKEIEETYTKVTKPLAARISTISEYLNTFVGQKYESIYTDIHLKSTKNFMHQLNPKTKDLKVARNSLEESQAYLVEQFGRIAGNDDSYVELMKSASKEQSKFDAKVIDKFVTKVKKYCESAFDGVLNSENYPQNSLAQALRETFTKGGSAKSSISKALDLYVEEKTAGIKATGHRQFIAADLERRINTGALKEQWIKLGGAEETFETAVEGCRRIAYRGNMSELFNKFFKEGNGEEGVRIVKLMFEEAMDDATLQNCNTVLKDALVKTRKNLLGIYSKAHDYARPGHTLKGNMDACLKTQYSMNGKALAESVMENADNLYNTRLWRNIFGGIGIAVLGVLFVSQMFFGKAKNEKFYNKENDQKQGGVNAASK